MSGVDYFLQLCFINFGELDQDALFDRIETELKLHGISLYRELIIAQWRLIYRITDRTVYVHAIIDSRRNLEDILLVRLIR